MNRRPLKAIGIVLLLFVGAEAAYLAHANHRLPRLLASMAPPGQRIAWSSAYTLYPGHLSLHDLRVAGDDWSIELSRVEVRLHPTRSLRSWAGQLWLPPQAVRVSLPAGETISAHVEGDVALAHVGLPAGPVELGEGALRVDAASLSANGGDGGTALLRLDRGGEANLRHPRATASLSARDLDAEALLTLAGLEPTARLALPLTDPGPVNLAARLELDGSTLQVTDLEARARRLEARGGLRWSPWSHAGAVLLDLEVVRAGISFTRGAAARVDVPADEAWLTRELATVATERAPSPPRADAWVHQGAQP